MRMTLSNLQSMILALADPIRLRVLYLLFAHQDHDWSVSAIVEVLELPQPTVSRHLARLREERLVDVTRKGKHRLYRLADRQSRLEQSLLAALESFVATTPEVQEDLRSCVATQIHRKRLIYVAHQSAQLLELDIGENELAVS